MGGEVLGARMTIDGSATIEIGIRIEAANRAFYQMIGPWKAAGVKWNVKVMMFKSMFMAVLLSGLTAFALRQSDYRRLEREACTNARKVVGEEGVKKGEK